MVAITMDVGQLFADEIASGISIYSGGRPSVQVSQLAPEEQSVISRVVDQYIESIRRVSPKLADLYGAQKSVVPKMAQIAKALFPIEKPIQFPSQPGGLGIIPIIPQTLKWDGTPDATDPCFTDYTNNSWDISLTAGTPAYLLGNATETNMYQSRTTSTSVAKNSFSFIFQGGVVENATTPKIDQFRVFTQADQKLGIWAPEPAVTQRIEDYKTLYQYPTIGVIPLYNNLGTILKVMPYVTGTSNIQLFGFTVYEHNFASDVIYTS